MIGIGDAGIPAAELCRRALQIGIGLALQSTLLLGLALLADWALRRCGPALRSLLYRVALAAALAGGLASLLMGRHFQPLWSVSLPSPSEPRVAASLLGTTGTDIGVGAPAPGVAATDPLALWMKTPLPDQVALERQTGSMSSREANPAGASPVPDSHPGALPQSPAGARFGALYLAGVGVWSAGALILLLRLLFCQLQLHCLRRRAMPIQTEAAQSLLADLCRALPVHPPLLLAGRRVRSPFLMGLWRPAVLLPADYERQFDSATLRLILAHELVHLARRDCAWNLLAWLACALGWVQPLLWVVRRRLVQTSEEVCDEEVVRIDGNPRAYASCLLTLSERFLPSAPERALGVGMAAFRSSLGRRIQQIMDGGRQRSLPLSSRLRVLVALGAVCAAALGLILVSAVAAPPPGPGRPSVDVSGLPLDETVRDARERQRAILEHVPALGRPVTFNETKIPLGELVQKVAAETGVTLLAAPNVADEPVLAVVKDLPARELLLQLADLLDYLWIRQGKEGAWRYEIWQDVASRKREEMLRQAALAGVEKRLREQISRFVTVASLAPAEIQRQAQEYDRQREAFFKLPYPQRMLVAPQVRPRLDRLAVAQKLRSSVNRSLASLLGRLSAEQWASLRSGKTLLFSTNPQPGELLLSDEMVRVFRSARPSMDTGSRFSDPETTEQERQRQREREAQWAAARGYQIQIRLDTSGFRQNGLLSLQANAATLPDAAPARPASSFFREPEGTSLNLAAEPIESTEEEQEGTPERNAALEKDPVLGARKTLKPEPQRGARPGELGRKTAWRVREMLPDLARAYGVSIIADSYEMDQSGFGLPGTDPIALYLFLDRYAGYVYRWDHHGKLIRLRNREWFFARPKEVPMRLVRRWQELYDQHGSLPLEEMLSAVTTLNDAQLQSADDLLQRYANETRQDPFAQPLYPARHALRLYAALSPGQQQALWNGSPIAAVRMTPPQRALFLAALQESVRSRQPEAGEPASSPTAVLAPDAILSLTHHRTIRVIQRGADSTTVTAEPAPEPEPARPPGAAPPNAAASPAVRRQGAVTRDPIAYLTFVLASGAERREQVSVTVASPH